MTSSPPKECTICRKSLKSRSSRHYHEHCQNPELKPFKCDHCERTFSSKSHKTFHEETHSGRRLQCNRCDKTYQHQRDLDLHYREHGSSLTVVGQGAKCNRCSEHFETQQALAQHKRTRHAASKQFKCDQCEMTFGLKGNLTKHAKIIHSKEKLFKCDQCGKAFYRNNALKFHMLNHRSRDFQCKTCQKEFVDARNLERHLKTHVTTKEFQCDICGISSSRKDNILRHARSFHPDCDIEKVVLKTEIPDQLDAIKKDAKQSSKSTPKKTDPKPTAAPISNRISVIQVVGKPKPVETPKAATAPFAVAAGPAKKTEPLPKPLPKVDPLEIYRKILNPSNDDDVERDNQPSKPRSPSTVNPVKTTITTSSTQASAASVNTTSANSTNNSSINNFTEVHWRKRTSQIYAINSSRGSEDREAASSSSGDQQVEHEISECIAAEDWKKVIDLGQALAFEERVKYLWLWPLQNDLERIGECLRRYRIGRVYSVGCGTGLLEWLITMATGIVVGGVEKDENWWRSKYAKRTYIPMVFADALTNVTENQGQPTWQAMMFCYFNHGVAFREYVKNFKGHYVIIAGPIEGKAVHTDPLPFSPKFPVDQEWERVQAFAVGSENLNHFVIYQRR